MFFHNNSLTIKIQYNSVVISNIRQGINGLSQKIILLDRDGTLIHNVPYLKDENKIQFLEGVIEGLKNAQEIGYKFIVVSNQSGIGRGLVTISDVDRINSIISKKLKKQKIILEEFIYCPHHPSDDCICRKPKPGMLKEVVKIKKNSENNFSFIGDMETDIHAAINAGIKGVLITSNFGEVNKLIINKASNFVQAISLIKKLDGFS